MKEKKKNIQKMNHDQFLEYIHTEAKSIQNYIEGGIVAAKETEKLFAKINRQIHYHIDQLCCNIELKELGIYGKVKLYRTRYGQPMNYKDLKDKSSSCFNKASVIIGREGSNKLYFQTFRKILDDWQYTLQDAKRSLRIHEKNQIFSDKEVQLIIDAMSRMNKKFKKFDKKYPTNINITV